MSQDLETPYGIGVYSVPEASRLTGVSGARLRRWAERYSDNSEELWRREIPLDSEEPMFLSFRDLIEAKWIDFFRRQRISWPTLRRVATLAAEELQTSHPFSTGHFAAVAADDPKAGKPFVVRKFDGPKLRGRIREVLTNQYLIESTIEPFLRQLEFRDGQVIRWYPLAGSRRVLVDPKVRFGAPVVKSGVPTELIWKNHARGGASFKALAKWWDIPEAEARDAVRWEEERRAA